MYNRENRAGETKPSSEHKTNNEGYKYTKNKHMELKRRQGYRQETGETDNSEVGRGGDRNNNNKNKNIWLDKQRKINKGRQAETEQGCYNIKKAHVVVLDCK